MTDKQYVATTPLYVDGVRAHNPGDPVPADNVKRNGWQDGVATVGTAAARKAAKATEPEDFDVTTAGALPPPPVPK